MTCVVQRQVISFWNHHKVCFLPAMIVSGLIYGRDVKPECIPIKVKEQFSTVDRIMAA